MFKYIYFVLLLLVLAPVDLSSQEIADTRGKEFWFTFMPNFHNYRFNDFAQTRSTQSPDSLYIFVSSDRPTKGTIEATNYYGQKTTWNFNIDNANDVFTLTLTDKLYALEGHNYGNLFNRYNQNLKKAAQHFVVRADDEVTVYALNKAQTTSDAATIFPKDVLGTNYTIVSYNSHGSFIRYPDGSYSDGRTPSQLAIVAVDNGTQVFIDPTTRINGSTNRISVTLNAGEVYFVHVDIVQDDAEEDLTGTKIISDKPVAVFAGHQRALIPRYNNSTNSRDHLFSQMRPDATYGQTYIVTPFPPTSLTPNISDDVFRVIAIDNSTQVVFNGKTIANLDAGEFFEDDLTVAGLIEANKKVIVAQYKGSNSNTNFYGDTYSSDPFMLLIPPMKQFLDNYTVTNIQVQNQEQRFLEQFITIICPTAYINTLKINGLTPNSNSFKKVAGTCFSYSLLKVADGTKNITSSKPFGVYSYGYGLADSYGYIGGMSFLTEEEILPAVSTNQSLCEGENITLQAQGGVDYLWFPSDNLSCDTCSNPTTLESKPGKYFVQITDRIGCVYLDSVSISIIPQPIADAGEDVLLCDDEIAELDAGTDAETFKWSPASGLSCTDCRYPTARPENTTIYYLEVSNGKCKSYDTIQVKVRNNPELLVNGNYEICNGDTAFVTIESDGQIVWEESDYISCTECKSTKLFPTETTTFYVSAISIDGCVTRDSLIVYVRDLPILEMPDNIQTCPGIEFKLHVTGATKYYWYPDEELSCNNCDNPTIIPVKTQMYYCEGENEFGCKTLDSVFVEVFEKPEIEIEPEIEICRNEQIELRLSGVSKCKWYPEDFLNCSDCLNPTMTAIEDVEYMVIGENDFGCIDTAFVSIKVRNCDIEIEPNVDFSNILLCNSDTQFLTIKNPNPTEIIVYELILNGADKSAFIFPEFTESIKIEGYSETNIPIQFVPYKVGTHTAQVSIISSADSTKTVILNGTAYLTEAIYNLSSDFKNTPTDTLTFNINMNIKALEELNVKAFKAKVIYDPIWMHFIEEYSVNEELLPDWNIDASVVGNRSDNYYLEFFAEGEKAIAESGEMFNFKSIILLSNTLEFMPKLEVSLYDKDFCVIDTSFSEQIELHYCVEDLRFIVISDNEYKFNLNSSISTGMISAQYEIPFNQNIIITVFDNMSNKDVIINEQKLKGSNEILLNLKHLTSGLYFIRFESGMYSKTQKLLIIK